MVLREIPKQQKAEEKRTIMIHGLLELIVSLFQHLSIDIYDVYSCFSTSILLPRKIKNTKCYISGSASNVYALLRSPPARL